MKKAVEPHHRSHVIDLPDERTLVVHDTGPDEADAPTVVWHHGTPQSGALLAPVVGAAAARGLRVLSPARAGYGESTRVPGRSVADAAADVSHALTVLGVSSCYAVGASGGGPHALALAGSRPDVVRGAVTLAGVAPYDGTERWFAGMADDAVRAGQEWPGGAVDDDVAYVRPWGTALADVAVPVLVVQGGEDRVIPQHHGEQLLDGLPAGELWLRPRDGHVSVLGALAVALDWLLALG
ncbi:alpha/beta fold hydrolase [Isoptericola halotolerans]|uniref:alpha/beta fold hydrolase n=1 Tax=Isoptericola halotolerans TaxID=300560 RepID=UPI00388E5CC1